MKNNRRKQIIFILLSIIIIVGVLVIAIISNNKGKEINSSNLSLDEYDENDPSYDKATAIYISFDGNSVLCDSNNVIVDSNSIKIINEGVYVLNGNYNGSVLVETDKKVRIILNQINISSNNGPAIYILNADKTYITLDENSTNVLEDTTNYSDEEATATIYSKDDLIFNGTGSLIVTGNYQDGIVSKDDLKIISGIYNITALNNGIKGKDSVKIKDGDIHIKAENDGIKATNSEEIDKGYIEINKGNIVIEAGHDAIQSEKYINIEDGVFDILSGGGSSNSTKVGTQQNDFFLKGKMSNAQEAQSSQEDTESFKGIKASGSITISGGILKINSADDSLHSNENITIDNVSFEAISGDDGINADNNIIINSGTIKINESYEGIEASNIDINGGDISVVADDDGINIAGGNDSSSIMGRPGQNNFSSSTNNKLTINNGKIYVNSTGDGLDSNGAIYINGGEIYVDGPENSGNGALDYESECVMKGGTLIAVGSSGMSQAISSNSSIYCLNANLNSTYSSNITITDSSNNVILEYSPSKTYSSIVVATPLFNNGSTYNLNIDGSKYSSFSISSIINTIGNSGNMMKQTNKQM